MYLIATARSVAGQRGLPIVLSDKTKMKINEDPTERQLKDLQKILSGERDAGIVDIWSVLDPLYMVAEEDGNAIGVATISMGDDIAELYKLYVVPTHRGKGVGGKLVENVVARVRDRNVEELIVEIAGNGADFWERWKARYQTTDYGSDKFGMLLNKPRQNGEKARQTKKPALRGVAGFCGDLVANQGGQSTPHESLGEINALARD